MKYTTILDMIAGLSLFFGLLICGFVYGQNQIITTCNNYSVFQHDATKYICVDSSKLETKKMERSELKDM